MAWELIQPLFSTKQVRAETFVEHSEPESWKLESAKPPTFSESALAPSSSNNLRDDGAPRGSCVRVAKILISHLRRRSMSLPVCPRALASSRSRSSAPSLSPKPQSRRWVSGRRRRKNASEKRHHVGGPGRRTQARMGSPIQERGGSHSFQSLANDQSAFEHIDLAFTANVCSLDSRRSSFVSLSFRDLGLEPSHTRTERQVRSVSLGRARERGPVVSELRKQSARRTQAPAHGPLSVRQEKRRKKEKSSANFRRREALEGKWFRSLGLSGVVA